MKANEAPEKIYYTPTGGGFYLTTIKSEPPFAEGIEYTRTNVFIDKACEWLENNLQGVVGGSIYIEDFRKYMGE